MENKFKIGSFTRFRIQDDNKFYWITFAGTLLYNWISLMINFFLLKFYKKAKKIDENPFKELLSIRDSPDPWEIFGFQNWDFPMLTPTCRSWIRLCLSSKYL